MHPYSVMFWYSHGFKHLNDYLFIKKLLNGISAVGRL